MNKRPEATRKTRERIVRAFWTVYEEVKSVRRVTVGTVSQKARVNRSTFYQYFVDIYALLDVVEDELIGEIQESAEEALTAGDPVAGFEEKGRRFLEAYGERLGILLCAEEANSFILKLTRAVKPIILDRFHLDAEDEETACLLMYELSGVIGCLQNWYLEGQRMPAATLVPLLQTFMRRTIGAPSDKFENIDG